MIYAIDNGEARDDHSIYFVESDLTGGPDGELLKVLPPGYTLIFVAEVGTWFGDNKPMQLTSIVSNAGSAGGALSYAEICVQRDWAFAIWIRHESSHFLALALPEEDDGALGRQIYLEGQGFGDSAKLHAQMMAAPPDQKEFWRPVPRPIREELTKRDALPVLNPCPLCLFNRCRCPPKRVPVRAGELPIPEMVGLNRSIDTITSGRVVMFARAHRDVSTGDLLLFSVGGIDGSVYAAQGRVQEGVRRGQMCRVEVVLDGISVRQLSEAVQEHAAAGERRERAEQAQAVGNQRGGKTEAARQWMAGARARGESVAVMSSRATAAMLERYTDGPQTFDPHRCPGCHVPEGQAHRDRCFHMDPQEARERELGERCFACGDDMGLEYYGGDQLRVMCEACARERRLNEYVPTIPAPTVRIEVRARSLQERLSPDSWKCPTCGTVVSGVHREEHWRGCSALVDWKTAPPK